tara:strand:- start:1757 stop:2545 length:789 start_codon:yes stop_codon:yes gene_type:complete
MIYTRCDNCVFATVVNDEQSNCSLNKAEVLGIEEVNENGYYSLQRFCNTYRPVEWLSDLNVAESENLHTTVMGEVFPRVGVFITLDTEDEDLSKLKETLNDVKNQTEGSFRYVAVITDKVEYNEGIQELFVSMFDYDATHHHIVQINTELPTKYHQIDEAFTHAKNGWIYITSSNKGVPRDLLSKMHQHINIDIKPLTVVKPYDDINGMIIQAALFKFLNGNKTKVFDDGSTDNRLFLDKVADMSTTDGSGSVLEWGDFYGA